MYVMTSRDKRELDAYRALGTVEELTERLRNPFPINDDYAPLPCMDDEGPLYEQDQSNVAEDTSHWTK